MTEILEALRQEFLVGSLAGATRMIVRLLVAIILGGAIGLNRQQLGKAAGLRTHILVCVGSALFVLAGLEAQMYSADLSRIVQGVVTGIGFLGGGVILKLTRKRQIRGVTTAATVWLTCGVGIAVGFGLHLLAALTVALALLVLAVLRRVEMHKASKA